MQSARRSARRKVDRELEVGTRAHYEDPSYYAAAYANRRADVAYYVDLVKRRARPRRVLELGCGNGRITLPLARAGAQILGVDLSRPMLADLGARLRAEPAEVRARVRVRRADMRSLRLAEHFDLVICPFNALLHLYERRDLERCFAAVLRHLGPRGRFVFDVSVPDPDELARTPDQLCRVPPFRYPGVGLVRYGERFEYDPVRQILFITMEFEPKDGSPPFATPLAHRQLFPQELEALLDHAGLPMVERLGDFAGPPTPESVTHVYVCKARAKRGR